MPVRRSANDDVGTDPDLELVLSAGSGDEDACAMLVSRYLSKVVALAGRMLANRADAEEIAQEVFLRVWQNTKRWKPGQALFSTWLYRVTLNLCTDRIRQKRPTESAEGIDVADESPSVVNQIQQQAVSSAVSAAMAGLPDRQREAIALCYYQDLDNTEAANVLGISVDALESLLSRGRRGLREILRGQAKDLIGEMS